MHTREHEPVLSSFCLAGVKSLLAGQQQAAVTVAVEGLMDAKANADPEAFVTFDPKVSPLRHVNMLMQFQFDLHIPCTLLSY